MGLVMYLMKARKCLIGIEKCWKEVKVLVRNKKVPDGSSKVLVEEVEVLVETKKMPDDSSKVPVEEVEVPDRNRKVLEESESAG
ncbi:MAG TPA: hypothetical protein VK947_13865 [Planococcus sp. (in: firmicutes)]|nr:hypothetical protein [Planococcus sp. (in: firmicutes)]